jgi:hypothetical protein
MFCGSLVQNTATIEFNVLLSLAGAGVAGVAKPAIYFTRPTDTALTTITASLITWSDMTGGWYHVKIADDASLGGLIAKTLGLLDFMINNVAATYDAVYRRFQVVSPTWERQLRISYGAISTDGWVHFRLEDTAGTGLTGKLVADLTCTYCKGADTSFTTYSPAAADLKEHGTGDYGLQIGASEFTTEEPYYLKIACSGAITERIVVFVGPYSWQVLGDKIALHDIFLRWIYPNSLLNGGQTKFTGTPV